MFFAGNRLSYFHAYFDYMANFIFLSLWKVIYFSITFYFLLSTFYFLPSVAYQTDPMVSSSSSMDQSKTDGAGRGLVLIRSHKEWLMHFRHQVGQTDATMAELLAIWLGMKLAWEKGYSKVILESNSAEAVQLINHLEVANSNCNLGCEVQLMMNMDWQQGRNQNFSSGGAKV